MDAAIPEDVLARLAKLEAKEAIATTLYAYGHAIDYGVRDSWLECFADDALLEFVYINDRLPGAVEPLSAAAPRRFAGCQEIGGFIDRHTRPPGRFHKHYLMEPVITVAADLESASARSYFLRVDLMPTGLQLRSFGRYVDRLKHDGGRWRIAHRLGEIEWSKALESPAAMEVAAT